MPTAVPDLLSSHAAADLLAVSHFVLDALVNKQGKGPPTLVRHCVERRDTPFEEYLSCDATVGGQLSDAELFNDSRREAAVAARLSHTEAFSCECASIHDLCLADRSVARCQLGSHNHATCPCALTGSCSPRGPCGYACPCDLQTARRGIGRMRFHVGVDFLFFHVREYPDGRIACDLTGGDDLADAPSRAQGYWYSMPAEAECAPIAATNPLSVLGVDGCSWARHDVQYVLSGRRLLASGVAASRHKRQPAQTMAPLDLSAEERMLADAFAAADGRCCGC